MSETKQAGSTDDAARWHSELQDSLRVLEAAMQEAGDLAADPERPVLDDDRLARAARLISNQAVARTFSKQLAATVLHRTHRRRRVLERNKRSRRGASRAGGSSSAPRFRVAADGRGSRVGQRPGAGRRGGIAMKGILRRRPVHHIDAGGDGHGDDDGDGDGDSASASASADHILSVPGQLRRETSDSGASMSSQGGDREHRSSSISAVSSLPPAIDTGKVPRASVAGDANAQESHRDRPTPRVALGVKDNNESLVVACEAAATSVLRRHERAAFARVDDILDVLRSTVQSVIDALESLEEHTNRRSSFVDAEDSETDLSADGDPLEMSTEER